MSVAVVGSANLDVVCRVPRIPAPGETALATSIDHVPGGKGSNQALAAARSGAATSFVCALGADEAAARIRRAHTGSGVELRARVSAAPTGTAHITVDADGENAIVVASGANEHLLDLREDELAAIDAARVLLLQLESPRSTVQEAIGRARARGVVSVVNASPVLPGTLQAVAGADVLIVNEHEVVQLAGQASADGSASAPRTVHDSAQQLTGRGHVLVVTLGSRGALLVRPDEDQHHTVAASRVPVVDTTGAGDTFSGAFAAALDLTPASGGGVPSTHDVLAAMRWASAAAALAVQVAGAEPSIPRRDAIQQLLDRTCAPTPPTTPPTTTPVAS